jgi:hypothetical protein
MPRSARSSASSKKIADRALGVAVGAVDPEQVARRAGGDGMGLPRRRCDAAATQQVGQAVMYPRQQDAAGKVVEVMAKPAFGASMGAGLFRQQQPRGADPLQGDKGCLAPLLGLPRQVMRPGRG